MTREQANMVETAVGWIIIAVGVAYMSGHVVAAYCDGRIF